MDDKRNPKLVLEPTSDLDSLENNPLFATFIQAIHKNAIDNPDKLKVISDIFTARVKKLIKGIDSDR